MDQLDGLRALAVLAVTFSHLSRSDWQLDVAWGRFGVLLFYVLSGYLITGILLRLRSSLERDGVSLGWCLKHFYARRALRIFPLYYTTLATAALLNMPDVRADFWWLASYTTNFFFTAQLDANAPWRGNSHLWSLAVEEQFYLLWPLVILLLPRRRLRPVIVTMVSFAPIFLAFGLGVCGRDWGYLPFANLDSLGLGAWLAIAQDELAPHDLARIMGRWLRWGLLATVLFQLYIWNGHVSLWVYSMQRFPACFVFGYLVWRGSRDLSGAAGRLLDCAMFRYIGRRSYAIYLLHPYVFELYPRVWMRVRLHFHWGTFLSLPGLPSFVLLHLITIVLAEISWRCLEGPANGLKRYFPYGRSPNAAERIKEWSTR